MVTFNICVCVCVTDSCCALRRAAMCSKNVHAGVKRETVHLPYMEQSDSALCPLSWKVLGLKPRLFLCASISPPTPSRLKTRRTEECAVSVRMCLRPGSLVTKYMVMAPAWLWRFLPPKGEATYRTFCEIEVVLFTDRESRKRYIYGVLDKHLMVRKLLSGFGSRRRDRDIRGWSEMSADIIHLMHKQPPLASV